MDQGQLLSIQNLVQGEASSDEQITGSLILEKLRLDTPGPLEEGTEATESFQNDDDIGDMEIVQTPPPSPTGTSKGKPSLFSLAQVSTKLGELWSSAKESIFGEDYWIPTDPNEIVFFPTELLRAHKVVFPVDDNSSVLRVVQGSLKNRPTDPLHHLVLTIDTPNAPSYSLFRSHELEEAEDLCRKCLDCKLLFTTLNANCDIRKPIQEILSKLHLNPLYKMVHIAIACNREDIFTDENVDYMNKNAVPFLSLMKIVAHPEGKYPLHLAIEMHRNKMVRRMLELGADPNIRDFSGNTIIHYAALVSVQMLEIVWEFDECHSLINSPNNEGYTPVMIAIRAANPRCLATLIGFGGEMNIRVQGRNALFEAVQNKGKNTDIIKAILDASPELLKETDSSGNTALHVAQHKTPLMGLLLLKHLELDLNAKNKAGQTPLHIYTHKGDIGLIITLSSYCCNINAHDDDGNTALHIAVSKKNLEATRLLLCLGADPNLTNNHGDTPRHLAARLKEAQLLKSLILCGAKRCKAQRLGCVSGCINESMLGLLKSSSFIECESPRTSTVLDAEKYPVDPLEESYHPIRDFTQKMYYEALIKKMEMLAARREKPKNLINLLSMDGGGIRGLVIIQMLMAIEEIMGEPVYPYFDWVAGTSTGALVATALAQGKTLRECQHIYLRFKDLIFDGWTRPFNTAVLETFMQEMIGQESLNEIKSPRLMISTVKADYFPVKLEFMRNYRLPLSDKDNEDLGFFNPSDIPTWKALRRTSAAPMFFSPVDNKYIDGGIIANNPCLDLLAEVELYNGTNIYLQREEDNVEIGCVLSLGTGQIPLSPLDPLHVEMNKPLSSVFSVVNLSMILVDQVTATEGAPVDRSRSWCNAIRKPFFRLSAPLHKEISLAAKDDHIIAAMMWDCIEYTHLQKPYIERLCVLLKKIGKSCDRTLSFNNGKTREMQTQTSHPSSPLMEAVHAHPVV